MAVVACGHLGDLAVFHGGKFGNVIKDDLECGYPVFNEAVDILVLPN